MTVLRGTGIEFESHFPFAAISELLGPLRDRMDELVAAQQDAVRALLGEAGRPGIDAFALAGGTLALLTSTAAARPVLVLIDDAQWLDEASAAVLSFVCRRLGRDAVAVLVSSRETGGIPGSWPVIRVHGLDPDTARELLDETAPTPVVASVAAQLAEQTMGNPLALIELAEELTPAQLGGRAPLPDPLPLGARGVISFGQRLARLAPETREALVILAAAGPAPNSVVQAALGRAGLGVHDLEAAEAAGVLHMRESMPRFVHPLVRAAAFASVAPATRRLAHRRLAEVTTDVERRAWHLAEATLGPSEAVALALEAAAEVASTRGGAVTSAPLLARAAEVSPEGAARSRRLLRAGEALLLAGQNGLAASVVDQALAADLERSQRAEALVLQGRIAQWATDAIPSRALQASYDGLKALGDQRAVIIGLLLARSVSMLGHAGPPVAVTTELVDIVAPDSPMMLSARLGHAASSLIAGDPRPLDDLPDELLEGVVTSSATTELNVVWDFLAQLWNWSDRHDEALGLLRRQVDTATQLSALTFLPYALTVLADVEIKVGDLSRARAAADRAVDLGTAGGLPGLTAFADAMRARVAAIEGDVRTCEAAGRAALATLPLPVPSALDMYINGAWGLSALGQGKARNAVEHLERNVELRDRFGAVLPVLVGWEGDYVQALAATGRRELAADALAVLEAESEQTHSRWGRGVARRGRALLDPDRARDALREAIELQHDYPFERARSLLVLGEHLRKRGAARAGRAELESAAELFRGCGATPWAEQADAALRATGVHRQRHGEEPRLTPQELQVALAIVDGATNKEAAAGLFLSTKTIEYHLGKAFQKLGVSNRTQLARVLRTTATETERSSSAPRAPR